MPIEAALIKPVVDALMGLFRQGHTCKLKHNAEAALREAIRELLLANPDENKAAARIAIAKAAGILSEDVALAEDMLKKHRDNGQGAHARQVRGWIAPARRAAEAARDDAKPKPPAKKTAPRKPAKPTSGAEQRGARLARRRQPAQSAAVPRAVSMPYTVQADEQHQLIEVVYTGPITSSTRICAMEDGALLLDAHGFARVLVDLRDASAAPEPLHAANAFAARIAHRPRVRNSRLAYVTPSGPARQPAGAEPGRSAPCRPGAFPQARRGAELAAAGSVDCPARRLPDRPCPTRCNSTSVAACSTCATTAWSRSPSGCRLPTRRCRCCARAACAAS